MSNLLKVEKMKEFAIDYFNKVDIDSSNFDYDFNQKTKELEIREDGQWLYCVEKRLEDFNGEKLDTFVLTARDVNNSDIYSAPTDLVD